MQELFRKWLDNQCSPEEVEELLGYFNHPEDETELRRFIFNSLDNMEGEEDGSRWSTETDRIFTQIKRELNPEKGKVLTFSKKKWLRLAVAAVLVAGIFTIYRYINSKTAPDQTIAKTNIVSDQIGPGGNKAILTLDNGSVVNLETASKDTVINQGNTTIIKQAEGLLLYKLLNEKPADISYNRIVTPRGGQFQLVLSDGTMVWLNAASSIHFPVVFTGNERKVEITGEAYFEVAKNAAMPFKVKIAEKAVVVVLGTHFNVNAYADEPTISTTLLEGSVRVTSLVQENSRTIVPGEQAELDAGNQIMVKKIPDAEEVVSWKNGTFNFHDSNLEMVLRELARWYDVDIVFEAAPPQKQFNGEIQRSLNLNQVIKLLEKNGVSCRIEGRRLIVSK